MSFAYASSEIIVGIIDITEKCSPGFVLITQVTAHIAGQRTLWAGYPTSLADVRRITRRYVCLSACDGYHQPRCPERDGPKRCPPRQALLDGLLRRGIGRFRLAAVLAPLPGPERGHVGTVHAPFGAVAPGVAGAGVDEDALAAGRLADAEPVDPQVGDPDGQSHHGARRVLVRDRAALGVVHVPGLAVVAGQLRVNGVLDQQRVQPRGGVLAVAVAAGHEEGAELGPKSPQRVEVVAGHAGVEVLAVSDQRAQPVQVGEPVTVLAPGTGRVPQPYREFSVGVEVHSRTPSFPSQAAGRLIGVMVCCRYRVLHHRLDRCQQQAGVLWHNGYTGHPVSLTRASSPRPSITVSNS